MLETVKSHAETCIKTLEYIPGIGYVTMWLSMECEQDALAYVRCLFSNRTPAITEQEIKEWQEVWEIIKDCDFEEIKKKYKVQFLRDDDYESPYRVEDLSEPPIIGNKYIVPCVFTNEVNSLHKTVCSQSQSIYRHLICIRKMPLQQSFAFAFGQAFIDDYKDKEIKCGRCPHKGVLLNSCPIIDGIITCPAHGLRFL